ncbi:MAG: DNA mismatch repair endonuclease MutL [Acidobacteria bacterium]|nr:DNA mismatch repair endonuclease MutL [Acidobacteriota bacterium]
MAKIQILPDILANKIAAGEVVERPASVVKELLENSLDAGSRRISVETSLGGKALIKISDDGEGMLREDAMLAFERHATSKIRNIEDLEKIQTLGFRGEALPSIASVSKVRLRTKTASELEGTEIEIMGGRILDVRDLAWTVGTEFEIKDLFFNVPARRKFLKSDSTENFHITNLITHYALANPKINFSLVQSGREVISTSTVETFKERAYQLFGADFIENLMEVEQTGEISIKGFVSKPQEQRASKDSQYLFVNGRFVRDRILAKAINDAYKNVIPAGSYPAVMLLIDLPSEEVDVNAHPAKTEVRFRRPYVVSESVSSAIRTAFSRIKPFARFPIQEKKISQIIEDKFAPNKIPNNKSQEPEQVTLSNKTLFDLPDVEDPFEKIEPLLEESTYKLKKDNPLFIDKELDPNNPGHITVDSITRPTLRISVDRLIDKNSDKNFDENSNENSDESFDKELDPDNPGQITIGGVTRPTLRILADTLSHAIVSPSSENIQIPTQAHSKITLSENLKSTPCQYDINSQEPKLEQVRNISSIKPLGQLRESFIVAIDSQGLMLIDQHVAHERILFEIHLARILEKNLEVQEMLIPDTIDLTPAQYMAFETSQEEFEQSGFQLMALSGRTIAIKAAPALLSTSDARKLVLELLSSLEKERRNLSLEYFQREIAASVACHAAIKVNTPLTEEKMQWLIDELMKTECPTNCPHGRPIILRFSMKDIEKGFKRI